MIKINDDWSFPQPSIKCNYCIQHTVKLLWCVCGDIIYATYLQRGIDLFLWMFYKRVSWVQVQGNMWLLGLIYNLINNDQSLELDSSLHFYCDLTLDCFVLLQFFSEAWLIPTFWHVSLVTCFLRDIALIKFIGGWILNLLLETWVCFLTQPVNSLYLGHTTYFPEFSVLSSAAWNQ